MRPLFAYRRMVAPVSLCLLISSGPPASARASARQERAPETARPEQAAARSDAAKPADTPKETSSATKHTITVGGQPLRYTATAGTMLLRDDKDKPQASMFYIAYTRDDVTDRARRPIFYSFNGGPGTASVWMHMGMTGPRRVVYEDEGFMLAPPFRLADNEHTILDVADIVYIDPVGTGYSRMAPGEDPHKFHGVMDDIRSVAEFSCTRRATAAGTRPNS